MKKISVKECAELLGLTRQAVLHRIKVGALKGEKDPQGNWLIELDEELKAKGEALTESLKHEISEDFKQVQHQVESLKSEHQQQVQSYQEIQSELHSLHESIASLKTQNEWLRTEIKEQQKKPSQKNIPTLPLLLFIALSGWFFHNLFQKAKEGPKVTLTEESTLATPKASKGIEAALQSGIDYLLSQRHHSVWKERPGITGLCISVLMDSNKIDPLTKQQCERSALELIQFQQPNGSIRSSHQVYATAMCLKAWKKFKHPDCLTAAQKAKQYLVHIQEEDGSISYQPGGKGTLHLLHAAFDALEKKDLSPEALKRAQSFIDLCQNIESNSDSDFGAFKYQKIQENQDPLSGSLAFSGLDSLLFQEVSKDDPRMIQGYQWIEQHFSAEENPGQGKTAYYYYAFMAAQVLEKLNIETLHTSDGPLDWRRAFAKELMASQQANGAWSNSDRKFLEGEPLLATAYAVGALHQLLWIDQ